MAGERFSKLTPKEQRIESLETTVKARIGEAQRIMDRLGLPVQIPDFNHYEPRNSLIKLTEIYKRLYALLNNTDSAAEARKNIRNANAKIAESFKNKRMLWLWQTELLEKNKLSEGDSEKLRTYNRNKNLIPQTDVLKNNMEAKAEVLAALEAILETIKLVMKEYRFASEDPEPTEFGFHKPKINTKFNARISKLR